jgi:RNA polymerase sigma-70 factor (ECF subfamily)
MGGFSERDASESELVAQAAAGDKSAFGRLVERYQRFAINIAYRMTGQPQLAEDLAQEAFLKAWLNLTRFRGESQFRTWLGRIVTNVTIDYLRRRSGESELSDGLPAGGMSPATHALRNELQERVRQAVLALPAQSRAALILREYEGLSYKEIAMVLDVPVGTVMSRLNYARGRLRETLEPEWSPADTMVEA